MTPLSTVTRPTMYSMPSPTVMIFLRTLALGKSMGEYKKVQFSTVVVTSLLPLIT